MAAFLGYVVNMQLGILDPRLVLFILISFFLQMPQKHKRKEGAKPRDAIDLRD